MYSSQQQHQQNYPASHRVLCSGPTRLQLRMNRSGRGSPAEWRIHPAASRERRAEHPACYSCTQNILPVTASHRTPVCHSVTQSRHLQSSRAVSIGEWGRVGTGGSGRIQVKSKREAIEAPMPESRRRHGFSIGWADTLKGPKAKGISVALYALWG